MKYIYILLIAFLAPGANAVIKRHDVDVVHYQVNKVPDFFIDMPFQGAAVLIDKHWLLTPAHVIYTYMYDYNNKPIMLHGIENEIADVIIHKDFKRIEGDWSKGDPSKLMAHMNNTHDIALVKLKRAVTHIKPINLYQYNNEVGMEFTGFGRGAIGTGIIGEIDESQGPSLIAYFGYQITKFFSDWAFTQEDYQLDNYHNVITEAENQWLRFTFEQGDKALPLEGIFGSGDSGGAAVIYRNSKPLLIGFAVWREIDDDFENHVHGKYGSTGVLTRVSYYNDWITDHITKGRK